MLVHKILPNYNQKTAVQKRPVTLSMSQSMPMNDCFSFGEALPKPSEFLDVYNKTINMFFEHRNIFQRSIENKELRTIRTKDGKELHVAQRQYGLSIKITDKEGLYEYYNLTPRGILKQPRVPGNSYAIEVKDPEKTIKVYEYLQEFLSKRTGK